MLFNVHLDFTSDCVTHSLASPATGHWGTCPRHQVPNV